MKRWLWFGCTALGLLLCGVSTSRADLIVNGGFETGDFSGWTVNAGATFVTTGGYGGVSAAHGGRYYAAMGNVGGLGTITQSQTIATTAGQQYDLNYWLSSDGDVPNEFKVAWDGVTLYDSTNIPRMGWTNFDFTVTGTGSDTLTFYERNDPGYLGLDDVTLNPLAANPVPEPASCTLLGIGAVGLFGYAWRRRTRAAA
jgi:hypothetical protein